MRSHLKPRCFEFYNLRTDICALYIGLQKACLNGIEHWVCNMVLSEPEIEIDIVFFGFGSFSVRQQLENLLAVYELGESYGTFTFTCLIIYIIIYRNYMIGFN